MLPDFEALVSAGYEYLPVGGTLLRPKFLPVETGNGQSPAAEKTAVS